MLIFAIFLPILVLLIFFHPISPNILGDKMDRLSYIFESQPFHFSLHPNDVDRGQNTVLIKSLSSTLLTTDRSLRPISNLAKSWSNSSDFKTWDFYLKNDLTCENGAAITNSHFIKTFNWILKIQAKRNQSITVFSKLLGWNQFISSDTSTVKGITLLPDNGVRFEFDSPIDTGILDFLSIPQFGFYCDANFDLDGNWIQVNQFISSGDYRLVNYINSGESVLLEKRDNWQLEKKGNYKKVTLGQSEKVNLAEKFNNPTLVVRNGGKVEDISEPFQVIEGAQIQLAAIILSPFIQNFFDDKNNRQSFRSKFYKWLKENPLSEKRFHQTKTFYPESSEISSDTRIDQKNFSIKNKIKINIVSSTSIPVDTVNHLISGIKFILPENQFEIKSEFLNRGDSASVKKYLSNRDYDIRINWGVIASMSNWIIDMMFCSNLGMSLPDAGGRVCQLVTEQNQKPMDMKIYSEKFQQIIEEESSIIPIYHTGSLWIHTNSVDTSDLSPLLPIPYIENLNQK